MYRLGYQTGEDKALLGRYPLIHLSSSCEAYSHSQWLNQYERVKLQTRTRVLYLGMNLAIH